MPFETELREATERAEAGQKAQAATILSNILVQDPQNLDALRGMVSVAGNKQEAISYLQRILQFSPGDQWALDELTKYASADDAAAGGKSKRVLLLVGVVAIGVCLCVGLASALFLGRDIIPTRSSSPDELDAYLDESFDYAVTMNNALNEFSELSAQAGDNPSLVLDESWRADIEVQMLIIQVAYLDFAKVVPPADMREVHALMVDGGQDCYDAMDHARAGFDFIDADELNTAATLIETCGTKTADATAMMSNVGQ